MLWYILAAGLAIILAYVVHVLTSSYGSHYTDNTLEAFIDHTSTVEDAATEESASERNYYNTEYTEPGRQLLVLYGTEYGFSEQVARELFDMIVSTAVHSDDTSPWQPRIVDMKDAGSVDLDKEQLMFVCMSTAGDGVAPSDAREFCERLDSSNPDLSHLHYSVLALGDSNYPHFCRAGRVLDYRLQQLGAVRVVDIHEVDQEDGSVISGWMSAVCQCLPRVGLGMKCRQDYLRRGDDCQQTTTSYSRTRPFMATLKVKRELSHPQAEKQTIHCEFDLSGSGITWTAGDALGVYPHNNPSEVDRLLSVIKWPANTRVQPPKRGTFQSTGSDLSLREALLTHYDLKHVRPQLVELLQRRAPQGCSDALKLGMLLQDGTSTNNSLLQNYLYEREVADVLAHFSQTTHTLDITDILGHLKTLQPRYYSISSSPKVDCNTACVTVAVVRYQSLGRDRTGVASTFLHDRLHINECCPVFISCNPEFRLPTDPQIPVIMIGPGTGLAPFRAFIQERVLSETRGPTWLYFGCRHKDQDFLYREQLEKWSESGQIRLRTAFSRQYGHEVYVQSLLREDANQLWPLLSEQAAHIYVCGDAKHMARDVHTALLQVICDAGNLSEHEAVTFMSTMEETGRYQRDVWVA